jgi:hypothetical protein
VSHADLSEVTGMVLVTGRVLAGRCPRCREEGRDGQVGSVVMLTTSHTATTRVLSVLANSTMAMGDMASPVDNSASASESFQRL